MIENLCGKSTHPPVAASSLISLHTDTKTKQRWLELNWAETPARTPELSTAERRMPELACGKLSAAQTMGTTADKHPTEQEKGRALFLFVQGENSSMKSITHSEAHAGAGKYHRDAPFPNPLPRRPEKINLKIKE
jgi:hypothetical protein